MKTRTLTLGAMCVLALVAVPLANANISVSACTDAQLHNCTGTSVGTNAASCHERESPLNGSIVDQPQCSLNG